MVITMENLLYSSRYVLYDLLPEWVIPPTKRTQFIFFLPTGYPVDTGGLNHSKLELNQLDCDKTTFATGTDPFNKKRILRSSNGLRAGKLSGMYTRQVCLCLVHDVDTDNHDEEITIVVLYGVVVNLVRSTRRRSMGLDRSVPGSIHTEYLSVLLTVRIFTNSEITESGTDDLSCCFSGLI